MDSVQDGAVTIDGGTAEEIQAELATETVDKSGHGTPTGEQKPESKTDESGDVVEQTAKEAKGDPAKSKGKKSLQARINDLTTERYTSDRARLAAEGERDRLQAELAALKRGTSPEEKRDRPEQRERAQPAITGEVSGVPLSAEKFPSYAEMLKTNADLELEDYTDLRQDWRSAKASALQQVETSQKTASVEFTKTAATFNERMAPVLESNPKFYESIDPLLTETPARSAMPPDHPGRNSFGPFIVEQIIRSDTPHELMQLLSADGSKELRRLGALSPTEVIREITKLELSIRPDDAVRPGPSSEEQSDLEADGNADEEEAAPVQRQGVQTSTQSKASPPVKPVRGSSQQSVDLEPSDEDSDDEWFRKEQARELKRLKLARA